MQAIPQLCDRAILLDHGPRRRRDGLGSDWSPNTSSPATERGPVGDGRRGTAPGNDLVRLRYVRVVQAGEEARAVDVRDPVGIEIGFDVLRVGGPPIVPKIKVVRLSGRRGVQRHGYARALAEILPPASWTAWIPAAMSSTRA